MSSFCFAKATHIFFIKNKCELDIVLTRTVNILTTNELIKLTMLLKLGPEFYGRVIDEELCKTAL